MASTVLCILLSSIITISVAEEITVSRADQDSFGTDKIGNMTSCYEWCSNANANQSPNADLGAKYYLCKCQCGWDPPTFLMKDKMCYKTSYLKTHRLFKVATVGLFLFGINVNDKVYDLNKGGKFDIGLLPSKDGSRCQIDNVTYLYQDEWISTDKSNWQIQTNNDKIQWTRALPKLMGKIIKIRLQGCDVYEHAAGQWHNDPNIFIKAKGKYSVDFSRKTFTSHVIHTSKTAINVMSSSIIKSTRTTTSFPKSIPTPLPNPSLISTIAVSTTSLHVGCSVSSMCSILPSATIPHPTPATTSTSIPKNKGGKEKQSSTTGAIVGSVIGFVVIVAVIVIIVYLCRKRRQKSRSKESANKSATNSKSNPVYGQKHGEAIILSQHPTHNDNELEYDYAAIDGDPRSHGNQATNEKAPQVYQSLMKDPAKDSMYTTLNRDQDTTPDQNYMYNNMERPLYNPPRQGTTDPLYNVLDRSKQDYLEPGVHIDKGRNRRPTSNPAPQNNEPVYNVLQDPNQDEPDYNVIEDPDSGYDYAQVGTNIRHPISHDNIGYESTLGINTKQPQRDPDYAVLEGPSSEPSYQALQIKVPDDKVYQTLDRTSHNLEQPSRNLEQPIYHVLEDKTKIGDV